MTLDRLQVRRVKLRLRAGATGFDVEPDLTTINPLTVPISVIENLGVDPSHLLGLRVRDRGMEPLLFEDDWIVIDTRDTAIRSGEIYAVNWNGEACIQQIVRHGGQWYLSYVNPAFKPINARSGQLDIVGKAIYQPGRLVTGRL